MLWFSILLFAAIIAIPGIPGIMEIRKPKDHERLHIPPAYARDPRFFGTSFRRMIWPFIEAANGNFPYKAELQLRDVETAEIDDLIDIAPDERRRGILVGREASIGDRAQIRDCYGFEKVTIGEHVIARTVASDGHVEIGAHARILRWLDVDGDVHVGEDVELGQSTSASGRVLLSAGVRFERAFGSPVEADDIRHEHTPKFPATKYFLTIEAGEIHDKDIVAHGHVLIKSGAVVKGSIKVHGNAHVEANALIEKNLIARGSVILAEGARVGGHVFSEEDVLIGPHVQVATADHLKSIYAAGTLRFMHAATLYGWAMAERGAKIG